MFRRSLITFALVLGGLFGTTTVSHTIQSRDLAGLRTSTREKANDVSTSSDLLRATAAVTPGKSRHQRILVGVFAQVKQSLNRLTQHHPARQK